MTQQSLSFHPKDTPKPGTLCGRVFDVLHARRGEWIDGRELAKIGGFAGFTARCRELRNRYGYDIENRWYEVRRDGKKFRVTEYRML